MAKFKDDMQQDWQLEITFGTVKRLRSRLGIDLLKPDDVRRVFDDMVMAVDVLFVIVEKEAERTEVNDEEFGRRLRFCVNQAITALLESFRDFFQGTGHATLAVLVGKTIDAMKEGRSADARLADKVDKSPLLTALRKNIAAIESKGEINLAKMMETLGNPSTV